MKSIKLQVLVIVLCVSSSFLTSKPPISAQATILGPILASRVVGGAWITFEDVGLNRTWRVTLPDSSFVPTAWSSDGCNLLLQGSRRWAVLSVPSTSIREVPLSPQVGSSAQQFGNMIWSFDGKALTSTVYLSNTDVRIYSVDLDTFALNLILSLNESGGAVKWLSETQLLYTIRGGDYYVWDTVTEKSSLYRRGFQFPATWSADVYLSEESPDLEQVAGYYSVNALRSFISGNSEIPSPDDMNSTYAATREPLPQIPGFDIYTFSDNSLRHVDVEGQLLQFLEWSPSSERIAVTTDPSTTPDDQNGIYVYTQRGELLERIDEFPAMTNTEYGGYAPTWSPDGNWLAFNTPVGYIIYNLTTKEIIQLSEQFDGFNMSLQWSPVMGYTETSC